MLLRFSLSGMWVAVVLGGLGLLGPRSARAQFALRPAVLYPIQAPGAEGKALAELRSLLESGLAGAEHRGSLLAARLPGSAAACGSLPKVECLSKLAGDGVVFFGSAKLSGTTAQYQLSAVDGKGGVAGPVSFTIDTFFQSTDAASEAMSRLTEQLSRTVAATDDVPKAMAEPPRGAAAAKETGQQERPGLAERLPAPDTPYLPEPPAQRSWMRTAGPAAAATGAALLLGGAITGLVDRSIANSLEEKYRTGKLLPSDRASYDRVRALNRAANACFIAGAIASAVGVGFWIAAPADSAGARLDVAFHGRF